mmetsp:Transcript_34433/g.60382  ORF Transcript_34433/g.60382 Transcript_34433/m.60382 type:complete len:196 (+) Transcript_34433:31-618(+)
MAQNTTLDAVIDGRYRLSAEIGRGSFGTVYKAFDSRENRYVALKVGKLNAVKSSEVVVMKLLSRHSGFPKLFNSGLAGSCRYISMQLLGANLQTVVEKRPLSLRGIGRMFLSILNRLKTMHKKGIVHRDLKLHHFVYDQDNIKLHLTDFGLSTTYDAERIYSIKSKRTKDLRTLSSVVFEPIIIKTLGLSMTWSL